MTITQRQKLKGFTLLEIMLVLAIASSLVVLMLNYSTQRSDELRRDKTVLQMQQILNAGMSFYLNNSFWPLKNETIGTTVCGNTSWTDTTLTSTDRMKPNYIPSNLTNNSYASPYYINCNNPTVGGGFYVYTTVNTAANAAIIAGRLPLAYITTPGSITGTAPPVQPGACQSAPYTGCTVVVASVTIPGQNLNNARSVNFASVYFSGSCVPAPNCPPNMSPSIMVMPASVSGVYDPVSCPSSSTTNLSLCSASVYPVSSFIAYARNDNSGKPGDPNGSGGSGPPLNCAGTAPQACVSTSSGGTLSSDGTKYWRVCLTVTTQKGLIVPSSTMITQQGKMTGSIVAITRCVPNSGTEKPTGSVNVWQQ